MNALAMTSLSATVATVAMIDLGELHRIAVNSQLPAAQRRLARREILRLGETLPDSGSRLVRLLKLRDGTITIGPMEIAAPGQKATDSSAWP